MTGARIARLGSLLVLTMLLFAVAYDLVERSEWEAAAVAFLSGMVASFFFGDSLINAAFDGVEP